MNQSFTGNMLKKVQACSAQKSFGGKCKSVNLAKSEADSKGPNRGLAFRGVICPPPPEHLRPSCRLGPLSVALRHHKFQTIRLPYLIHRLHGNFAHQWH